MSTRAAPALTPRGLAWGLGATGLLAVGALARAPVAAAMGGLALGALAAAYLRAFAPAAMIWRRHVQLHLELVSQGGRGPTPGSPILLRARLRNHGPWPLGQGALSIFAADPLGSLGPLTLAVPARGEAEVTITLRPTRAGRWHVHGAALVVRDPLGICATQGYFPAPAVATVWPRLGLQRGARARSGADRPGPRARPVRGEDGELREVRDHVPGDPFRRIAWGATARTGRLMVRELEEQRLTTHVILVDVGPSMREGHPGSCRLDTALELVAGEATAALARGDRVGLVAFDARVVRDVAPGAGPGQRQRILEALVELASPVDEDATELTDSELVAAVARYLLSQEGRDTRAARPASIDDPRWARLAPGPEGQLYDLELLAQAIGPTVARERGPAIQAKADGLARLRRYCRARGITLPARRPGHADELAARRAEGLAGALEKALGPHRVVLVSDLAQLEGGFEAVVRAVARLRRRGGTLVARIPGRPAQGEQGDLADILRWTAARHRLSVRQRLRALRVAVVDAPAHDRRQAAPEGPLPEVAA